MDKKLLESILQERGFQVEEAQLSSLIRYAELLLEYNQKFNLTAITEEKEIITKHFIDSMQSSQQIKDAQIITDIGSGAGFPSIPLKILYPEKEFVLLDSLNKRIGFLNVVIEQLQLTKIQTKHIRIEEAGQSAVYREKSDIVLARAVASLNTLIEYAVPLLKTGGRLIAYKGEKIYDEIEQAKRAMEKLRCQTTEISEYDIEGRSRFLITIEKKQQTPSIYPRQNNKPKRNPL